MKKITLFLILTVCGFNATKAQSILRFTPSLGTGEVYTNLDSAYTDAQDDDILYLSGNTFLFTPNYIEKRLTWVGAGIHSDSTNATGETKLNPTFSTQNLLSIRPGAGSSSFSGINFGGMRLYDCDVAGNISLVTFSRCKFMSTSISLSYNSNYIGSVLSYRFQECIFNTFVEGNGFQTSAPSNITFDNCLFAKGLFRLRTGAYTFNNCIFWATSQYDRIQQNSGCTFNDCIFWDAADPDFLSYDGLPSGNVFNRCVFSHPTIPAGSSGTNPTVINNCIANVTDLFVNTNGNFAYEDGDDFHLLTGSAALTAGADGGQCGIYGGAVPAKQGFVPFNPHISSATIAPATINGTLNISIRTTSQSY